MRLTTISVSAKINFLYNYSMHNSLEKQSIFHTNQIQNLANLFEQAILWVSSQIKTLAKWNFCVVWLAEWFLSMK